MTWDRKEVAGLLMAGAAVISGIETAIFGKWVDGRLQQESLPTGASVAATLTIIASVGLVSTALLAGTWWFSRTRMSDSLDPMERLDRRISLAVMGVFGAICVGWIVALAAS